MQTLTLELQIDYPGTCEAAFRLYEQCLRGQLTCMLRYGDSPIASQHPESANSMAHATLRLGAYTLVGVDMPPAQYRPPQGFTVLLNPASEAEARRLFAALSAEGQVLVPLQPTFWAKLYAVLTDRFGTPWKINYSLPTADQP